MFIPIAIILAFLKFFLMVISKAMENSINFHHQYSGWVGFLLSVSQLSMFCYFMYNVVQSIKSARVKKAKSFMINLGVFGTIYFLTFPTVLFWTSMLVSYAYQKSFVEFFRILSEFVSIYYLAYITTNEQG